MRRLTCAWIAAALALAPLCARGADLVVWWPEGYYAEEDAAVRETIAAFEQDSGKEVGLVFYSDEELLDRIAAGLEGGQLPDFVFGFWRPNYIQNWVLEDQLVDLTDAIGHFSDLFDPIQLDRAVLLNTKTGRKALYGLPIGQISNYVHVWKGLLEGAGLTLEDIPKEWGRSGRSGATRSSLRYAGHWAATTFGASAGPCPQRLVTPPTSSSSSSMPTMRTT
jgi:multiple sugar transport system substrate-binding protein